MERIEYPVKGRKLEQMITQETLEKLLAQYDNWQQGPGVYGRLNLHACWNEAGSLDKRYQGETIAMVVHQLDVIRRLYDLTGETRFLVTANAMAAHLLYLQTESGGFIHSTSEFEPTFDTSGCPISWFNPVIGLCRFYMWAPGDAHIKSLIPEAVDRHWKWSLGTAWKNGNGWKKRPLDFPGWCGVTNQDLVAVLALALSMEALGRKEPFEQYGKPVLDYYLSPAYYHKELGVFERGDNPNYAERTCYHLIILDCLKEIYRITGDERLPEVVDNVTKHLFDAVYVGADGLAYLQRGINTYPDDKTRIAGWESGSTAFSEYPGLIKHMEAYARRHPEEERMPAVEALKDTVAAWIRVDGSLPGGLFGTDPLFSLPSCCDGGGYIHMVLDMVGDKLQPLRKVQLPAIHRTLRGVTWKQKGALWAIERDGVRCFGGYSRFPGGVTIGPEEKPVFGDYGELETAEVEEVLHCEAQ